MKHFIFFLFLVFFTCTNLFSNQTVRIAAIRVEFVKDTNVFTTGDGSFLVDSVTTDVFAIDPAPHNRTYFNDQLIAADNYFNNVSGGQVRITGDVFPGDLNGAYQLPFQMAHYNPNTSTGEIDRGIANLFIDALQAADTDAAINFSQYDLVVIFHAGVGRDVDLGFDETPQDIPSLFVTEQFMKENWDETFSGFSVDDGSAQIKQAIILPETENQQDVQLALTGIFVSNIGSYLGLNDLFSPSEQRSGIGRFGLMDVGLFNVSGLIPAPPCSFSRIKLGWEQPLVLREDKQNNQIARFNSPVSEFIPRVIEIPINEDESYLLEFRGNPADNIDSLQFEISENREEFATYLEVLKTFYSDRIEISDSSGVLLSVDDYDLGLPGAGILIWHIDQSVVRSAQNNAINDNPEWRAVDLEEADGSQDIGEQYSLLQAGFQTELGTWLDYWFNTNPTPLYKNEFSAESIPSTSSNLNHAKTGITISDFSNNSADIMTFNYKQDFYEDGFPVEEKRFDSGTTFSISGIPENHDNDFIFTINDSGYVFAVGQQGKGIFSNHKNLIARTTINSNMRKSIALADTNDNKQADLLFAMSGGALFGFDLKNADADSLAQLVFATDVLTSAVNSNIVVSGNNVFLIDGTRLLKFHFDGTEEPSSNLDVEIKDLLMDRVSPLIVDKNFEFIARINPDKLIIVDNPQTGSIEQSEISVYDLINLEFTASFLAEPVNAQFSLTDMDGNGSIDIVYNSFDRIVCRNQNGPYVANFPLYPDLTENENLVGTPMIFDLSGDGEMAVLATTNKGQILAYNNKGRMLTGFPVSAGGNFSEGALLVRFDQDNALKIIAVSNSATFSAWELPGSSSASKIFWGMSDLNTANNAYFQDTFTIQSFGPGLVSDKHFYNYPNPNEGNITTIRYYLNDAAKVKLRIFDASGYKVDEFEGPGIAATANEVVWNVQDVASGVYLCQLQAESAGKTERKIIKILVVH